MPQLGFLDEDDDGNDAEYDNFAFTEEDKKYHASQAQIIKNILVEAGDWVGTDYLKTINHRFSACFLNLRQQGHIIERRKRRYHCNEWLWVRQEEVRSTKKKKWQRLYYKSKHWHEMRHTRLVYDNFHCCICHGTSSLHVHHWRYDLFNEDLCDLMSLCAPCHEFIHDNVRLAFPKSVPVSIYERLIPADDE